MDDRRGRGRNICRRESQSCFVLLLVCGLKDSRVKSCECV